MNGLKILGHGIKMEVLNMFKYYKKLEYPINLTKKDLKMAKYIITGLGGSAGELAAATRYYIQSFSMH